VAGDSDDPEAVLKKLISDMKEGYREAAEQVEQAAADEALMRQRMEDARQQAENLRSQARLAAARGDAGEARKAERSANELAEVHAHYGKEWERQSAGVAQLKVALAAMAEKIESAERQAEHLLQRRARESHGGPDRP
jgi:phage shock protein A